MYSQSIKINESKAGEPHGPDPVVLDLGAERGIGRKEDFIRLKLLHS